MLRLLPDVVEYEQTGEVVDFDQATMTSPGGRLYLADGEWCQLWDSDLLFVPQIGRLIFEEPNQFDGPSALAGTRALAVVFSSVTSTYGFWLYDDGALVRQAIFESGEPVDEVGQPLPMEADVPIPSWGHDEDFVWAVIHEVTGLGQSGDQRFAVYTYELG